MAPEVARQPVLKRLYVFMHIFFCFNLLSVNLSLHTFSNTLCTRGAPPKAKLLLRKRRHTPRELYCRRPHPRLAHVPALWRDHRRHRHALLGSAVAMDRREGLALRPRPAGLLALAGKPVWNTRAASQSISARRPRLEAALARARSSAGGACAGGRMFRPIGRGPWAAALDSGGRPHLDGDAPAVREWQHLVHVLDA